MLKPLAIVLSLIIIVVRGMGMVDPEAFRRLVAWLISAKRNVRALGTSVIVFAVLIFLALGGDWSGARMVMVVMAFFMIVGGVFPLLLPAPYTTIAAWVTTFSDKAIRVISGIGLSFGVIPLILGLACY